MHKKNRATQFISLLLALVMALGVAIGGGSRASASNAAQFTDVNSGDYFADAVQWAVDEGITSGTSATKFSPNEDCTVAQIVTFLWRANGSPSMYGMRGGIDNPFSDVKDSDYYLEAAAWAYKCGIVSGGTFGGDAPCTRAMAVTYMWKAAGSPSADPASFTDVPDGAEYADAVAWAVEQGVTSGTSAAAFSPDDVCTRGQIVTFLYQWLGGSAAAADTDDGVVFVPDTDDGPSIDAVTDTMVDYGTSSYPNLTNIGYDTYRKLDYLEEDQKGRSTYFYDFRNTYYAGANAKNPEKGPNPWEPGLYGVTANTKGDTLTYTAYTEIDNAKVKSVEFRTYDQTRTIKLTATANTELSTTTTKLDNGPYWFIAYFDYTDADGEATTVGVGVTLYVSGGKGYFAQYTRQKDDTAMESFLTKERNNIATDDAFQAWVAKQGGNDLKKATSLTNISYPFKSGTTRYPDNAPKWRQLAHEICPDDDMGEYAKAAALFDWMNSNLAYDKDALGNWTTLGNGDYRWAVAAYTGNGTGFTTWDSHVGKCEDFANIYTIMARELGIPSHVMTDQGHAWSIVYIRGRWETVDPTAAIRSACLGTNNKSFIANAKEFWANEKTGDEYDTRWYGFINFAKGTYSVRFGEKYTTIEEKFADKNYFEPLNYYLHDSAGYARWAGTIYGH